MMPRSNCQAINEPNYKTWEEYKNGCLMTYHAGIEKAEELAAFQHGMKTIFRLLEAEFPQPHEIFNEAIPREQYDRVVGLLKEGLKCKNELWRAERGPEWEKEVEEILKS